MEVETLATDLPATALTIEAAPSPAGGQVDLPPAGHPDVLVWEAFLLYFSFTHAALYSSMKKNAS